VPPVREEPCVIVWPSARLGPLALVALLLLGCPPALPPTTAARVLEWTLGPQNLASPTSPDAFLILIPKDKLIAKPTPKPSQPGATRLSTEDPPMDPDNRLSECIRATSVLPAPRDGRIFLAVDGALHVLGPDKTTSALEGIKKSVHVNALLAVREVPSGLEILASVRTEDAAAPQIHALTVNSTGVVRADHADDRHRPRGPRGPLLQERRRALSRLYRPAMQARRQ
jgi:hypothetical protein